MDFNVIKAIFLLFTAMVFIMSFLIHSIEHYIPLFFKQTFRYGKYAEVEQHFFVKYCEVPKRWFSHFYLFATPMSTFTLILCVLRYFCDYKLYQIYGILDLGLSTARQPLISPEKTLLVMVLITCHCWKRLYETHRISVFSEVKINITHYMVGFIHYIGVFFCIIGESCGFFKDSNCTFHWNDLSFTDIICATIFVWVSFAQLKSNIILANLRKNENGVVITKSYKIPHGQLFDYISSPLQFTEITMYLMLTIILWNSSSFHYIFLWVLVNQTETALSTHQWYKKTFKNYPQRKIYIPFLI